VERLAVGVDAEGEGGDGVEEAQAKLGLGADVRAWTLGRDAVPEGEDQGVAGAHGVKWRVAVDTGHAERKDAPGAKGRDDAGADRAQDRAGQRSGQVDDEDAARGQMGPARVEGLERRKRRWR
jgi:hypothetical protein